MRYTSIGIRLFSLEISTHSSPDRFTGQRSTLGESTSGEFMDKSTGHRRDRTGQKSPTKSTEPDRTGPDRTGCQSPDESTGHGTGSDRTELGVDLQTSPPVTDQSSYLPVKGRQISLPVSSNCLLYNMEEFQWGKGHPLNSLLQFGIWDIVLAEVQLLPVETDILLDRIRQKVLITGK